MKLISELKISEFRSISSEALSEAGDFTALAGINNSGKSNFLRALNAFFTGNTDVATRLSVDQDYFRPHLKKKQTKRIRVSVRFTLPSQFTFRRNLEAVRDFLSGDTFEITKEWIRSEPAPRYTLNGGNALSVEHRVLVDQFLSLISFRYIPNRVLPLDIIRSEHQALRDVLVRRLASKTKGQNEAFKALKETSTALLRGLADHVREASPDVGQVRLATPVNWQDMVFAFGYKLASGDTEIDDFAQGSGIQSLLMLETLALIDRDYFQQFGWKQAAVWALEEPESSLHSSLEAKIASYLAEIASDSSGRLQIFATTHSDLMLQHADRTAYVLKSGDATTLSQVSNKYDVLREAAQSGISRWVHPILLHPLEPVILVEGKYDFAFIDRAFHLLQPKRRCRVSYLEQIQGGDVTGGERELLRYVKLNLNAIRVRVPEAPIVVVLDWESKTKVKEFQKLVEPGVSCTILAWPVSIANPKLGTAFHGIERFMPDRVIQQGNATCEVLGSKANGWTIASEDLGKFKKAVFEVVTKGLELNDLIYSKPFLDSILEAALAK